jgi:hypothetical protein
MERTLHIELEDAASSSWWARILYTLTSQYGRTPLSFVGKTADNQRLYLSDTFPGHPCETPFPRKPGPPAWKQA